MTFACSILIASVLTILLPIAAHVSFRACLVVRACIGLAESAAFPAAYNMYGYIVTGLINAFNVFFELKRVGTPCGSLPVSRQL